MYLLRCGIYECRQCRVILCLAREDVEWLGYPRGWSTWFENVYLRVLRNK